MIRDHITTAFEVIGLAMLVTAAGLFVAGIAGSPAGFFTAGVLCLVCSALIVARKPKRSGSEAETG